MDTALVALGLVLVVAAAVLLAARWSASRRHLTLLPATFSTAAPLPALGAVPALALSAGTASALAAAALTGVAVAVCGAPFARRRPPFRDDARLTVLTANLWAGRGDPQALLAVARDTRSDVLALQEVTQECVAALRDAGIDDAYPHAVLAPAPMFDGVALWSRYPLRDPRIEQHGHLMRVEAVVGTHPDDPERDPVVISVHLDSPWPNPPDTWFDQLTALGPDLRGRTGPLVVAGDLNATLGHRPFRRLLTGGLTDAAATTRAWGLRTYPQQRVAVAGLDHIVSRGLHAERVRTHGIPGSDHRAVTARLGWALPPS